MSWITESDLNSAQANVRLAQALAAAQWNPARVALPQDVLSKVTELVIPEGTHPEVQNVRYQYDMSPYKNGLFAKMPNLKKVVIGNRTALPSYYFAFLKAEEVQVPVDIADVDDRPSNLFTNSSVKRVLVTAPSSPCDWEELARDGRSLFWESKIQSIRFAEGIECVPRNCCYGCSVLESVELPRSCRIIGCYAFQGCNMLTVVRIPDGCALFDSAFRDCNRLDHIEGRIGRLGPSAFEDSGIRSAELDVPEVEQNAFYQCHRLTSVKLGPNVSRIQYCAFRECWSLKSINMPNVRQVAAHAFRGCTAITSISIGNPELNALVDNNDYAPFRGCSGIRTAVFGFRTGNRVLRLMQNLGLTENQACKVTVASADFNPSFALLLQGLISAGFAPTMYRGTLLVAFDEAEGLTAEQADALAGVIQANQRNFGVVFADQNRKAVQQLQDLSQIKTALFVRTAG